MWIKKGKEKVQSCVQCYNEDLNGHHHLLYFIMGESFQDYSWIQDFEADFPQKVSLKMLN